MGTPLQTGQHPVRIVDIGRFSEKGVLEIDHRVRSDYKTLRMHVRNRLGLDPGVGLAEVGDKVVAIDQFLNMAGNDLKLDIHGGKQLRTSWGRGGQYHWRKVIHKIWSALGEPTDGKLTRFCCDRKRTPQR